MFVAAYFAERAAGGGPAWTEYVDRLRLLYGARRDAMLGALEEHFGDGASWTRPQGGLFIWATLDERIDTTDLLALARKSGVAFVPGRAAFTDGRSGSSSMRLNFAGVPEQEIREGVRRIGGAVREQLGLLGSLTWPGRGGGRAAPSAPPEPLADVLELPRRPAQEKPRLSSDI